MNLLSNAFKFTPRGGRVRCSLSEVRHGDRAFARLEVADSGQGIPVEQREAVFERFHQLEGGATRRFGGTALGLAIADDFVERQGGPIRVATAAEGEALFIVEVPLRAPEGTKVRAALKEPDVQIRVAARVTLDELRSRGEAMAESRVRGARGLVLVVEDN